MMGGTPRSVKRRPATIITLLILVGLAATASVSPLASAHLPEFDAGGGSYGEALVIDDISVSYAFYGDLPYMEWGDPNGARYFVFEGEEGQQFEFMIGVKPETHVYPGVLLVGPGLPGPDSVAESIINSTGVEIPAGLGVVGWQWWANGTVPPWIDVFFEKEFEPFTQTQYHTVNRGNASLPASGVYHIIVTGAVSSDLTEKRSVKYFLVTGSEEVFGLVDFALISWYWFKVQSLWGGADGIYFLTPTMVVVSIGLALDLGSNRKNGSIGQWSRARVISHYSGTTGALLMIGIGVNQVVLLASYSSLHDWGGIVILVLTMQAACIILGLFALRTVSSHLDRPSLPAIGRVTAITAAALLFGAGMIVGPALFVLGATIAWASWVHARRKRRPHR